MILNICYFPIRSRIEHQIPNLGAMGSNPVGRTNFRAHYFHPPSALSAKPLAPGVSSR